MALKLELSMGRAKVPLGGEIPLHLSLVNDGPAPVGVASLAEAAGTMSYAILDGDRRPMGTVNHTTRQAAIGSDGANPGGEEVVTLAPGGKALGLDNLCRYHWFGEPGVYFVRARYTWRETTVWSETQTFEVIGAPLSAYDQQWNYHYGEKFLLHSTWVANLPDGSSELCLRESGSSNLSLANYNVSLGGVDDQLSPRISFNRSLMADGQVWIAWLGDASVTVVRIQDGHVAVPARVHALGLEGMEWVAAPLTSNQGDLLLVLSAMKPDGGRMVMTVRLGPDGSELDRSVIANALPGAIFMTAVCDATESLHLFWLTGDSHAIFHQIVDLETLRPLPSAIRLWRAPGPPVGLLTPSVLGPDSTVACLYLFQNPGNGMSAAPPSIGLAWLRMTPASNPVKLEDLHLPEAETLVRFSGETTEIGGLVALLTTRRGIYYVNSTRTRPDLVASSRGLDPRGPERLIVTASGDVHLVTNQAGQGLSLRLLHAASARER